MPQPIGAAQTIRLRVVCYTDKQVAVNTVQYLCTISNGTGQTDLAVASAMDAVLHTAYKACLSAQAKYRGVSIQKILPLPAWAPQVVTGNDGAGGVAGDMMSTQSCGIITAKTNFAGARGRGRVYIPFPGEASNDATAIPSTTYVTNLNGIGTLLFNPWTIGGAPNQVTLEPIIFNRVTGGALMVSSYVSQRKWANQRRRGDYGKYNSLPF